jgi:preprotein translocase subunit SecE
VKRNVTKMPTEEDVKKETEDEASPAAEADEPSVGVSSPEGTAMTTATAEVHDVALVGGVESPSQLGMKRFVYAGYFAGAIFIAFAASKLIDFAWFKAAGYKPAIGEPKDEIVMPLAALIGLGAALYYWYRTRARQLAEEVANEMGKVTWPSRTEVTNGTFVVIVTTIVSTVFFALMDKFWGFLTNLVYGGS